MGGLLCRGLWGATEPLVYERKAAVTRAAVDSDEGDSNRKAQRRRTAEPGQRPPRPPPAPGQPWPAWTTQAVGSANTNKFRYDGRDYACSSRGEDGAGGHGKTCVRAILVDGSLGPVVGSRLPDGQLSLNPGEWAGELLDGMPLPPIAPGSLCQPPEWLTDQAVEAGVAAVGRGEAWQLPLAIDSATVAAARTEVDALLKQGHLHVRNHGQQARVRNDLVGFLPLSEVATASAPPPENPGTNLGSEVGGDNEREEGEEQRQCISACPPAIARCYQRLIGLAGLRGMATAVTVSHRVYPCPPQAYSRVFFRSQSTSFLHMLTLCSLLHNYARAVRHS